jgi:hypothetical protein
MVIVTFASPRTGAHVAEEPEIAVARFARAVAAALLNLADDLSTSAGRAHPVEQAETEADDEMEFPVGP